MGGGNAKSAFGGPDVGQSAPPGPAKKQTSHWDDDVEEQVIPELEDEAQEDITTKVAAPPIVRGINLQSGRELSQGIGAAPMMGADADIDLSILLQHLCTEQQVTEPDVPWENEILEEEVKSEVTKTTEPVEGEMEG